MSSSPVTFRVAGDPVPQGSMKPVRVRQKGGGYGRILLVPNDPAKLKGWRSAVAYAAAEHFSHPMSGPMVVRLEFQLRRGKTVKRDAPTVPPDVDKLARACLDALTWVAWVDDGQVVELRSSKVYGKPGVTITIARPA